MQFDSAAYGAEVASLLALDGNGSRLMPLAGGTCSSAEARKRLAAASSERLFPGARAPEAALSGLWLYFSCLDEAHRVAQDVQSTEGSYWHAIMHRQEPDPGNSGYWFRRVGQHPVFEALGAEAATLASRYPEVGTRFAVLWDPFAFIEFCEAARLQPGSRLEALAREIQRAEWQLLFDYCAKAK